MKKDFSLFRCFLEIYQSFEAHYNMTIYRLITQKDWQRAQILKRVGASNNDIASGFMHFSPKEEVLETAKRYFDPALNPLVLEVDESSLMDRLRFEVVASRNHASFPHLYDDSFSVDIVSAVILLQYSKNQHWAWGERVQFP